LTEFSPGDPLPQSLSVKTFIKKNWPIVMKFIQVYIFKSFLSIYYISYLWQPSLPSLITIRNPGSNPSSLATFCAVYSKCPKSGFWSSLAFDKRFKPSFSNNNVIQYVPRLVTVCWGTKIDDELCNYCCEMTLYCCLPLGITKKCTGPWGFMSRKAILNHLRSNASSLWWKPKSHT
jgi:hypothetical protein